ncbi:MAG: hypothetical protein A2W46_02545 [Alphaproteobacteria bacterium RIFCSPHIGHO2_12_42_13]|nr:MAG: hypothetical protein A2W46_02545 [Alphaproteobacteria bacterium RIFCSPHIGHO2_12_42_13]HBG34388.1 hypothetical protein [Holosporales bacterium]HBW24150.1 hypothetical protein [Holosporales bacterium]
MKRKGKLMTNKLNPTLKKQTSPKKKILRHQEPLQDKEKFLSIEQKIQRLRQKREKLHMNQALFFTKEVQRILEDEFSLEMALVILEKTWTTASKSQKEEWSKRVPSFRASFFSAYEKESQAHDPIPQQI